MNLRILFVSALVTGCATTSRAPAVSAPTHQAEEGLPFIENDYARALQEARTRGVPLFVDVWAPW